MKKLSISLFAILFVFSISGLFTDLAMTNSASAPNGFTGAPGENNCTTCHSGTVNSGSGNVSIDFNSGATTYALSSTYNIKVDVNDGSAATYGFSLVALDQNGSNVGIMNITNASNTKTSTQGGKTYVTHVNANSQITSSWEFEWASPATNMGDVTFYVAGNATNGGSNNSGDLIYTSNKTISAPAVGVDDITNGTKLELYPSFFKNNINITGLNNNNVVVSIFNLNGQLIESFAQEAQRLTRLELGFLNKGVYILQINDGKKIHTNKVFKII